MKANGNTTINQTLDEIHKTATEAAYSTATNAASGGARRAASGPPQPPLTGMPGFIDAFKKEIRKDLGLGGSGGKS